MELIPYLVDLLKYIIAGLIIFFVAWFFIKAYLDRACDLKAQELKKGTQAHTFPLRLQAYERIILFLERINPAALLVRLHVPGMGAQEMQNIILADIRAEYQHNLSQQLYVSNQAWEVIKKIKEDTIRLVNDASHSLPENAPAIELSKVILTHLATLENENPYDVALVIIKQDIQQLF
ncbi:MAG TPA: hypothetical protein VGD31_14010 [Sphingobacteriaceae bacterium]